MPHLGLIAQHAKICCNFTFCVQGELKDGSSKRGSQKNLRLRRHGGLSGLLGGLSLYVLAILVLSQISLQALGSGLLLILGRGGARSRVPVDCRLVSNGRRGF